MQAVFALVSELGIIFRHFATNVNVMLIYGNITDRQTEKHIKSIVRNLNELRLNFVRVIYLKKVFC